MKKNSLNDTHPSSRSDRMRQCSDKESFVRHQAKSFDEKVNSFADKNAVSEQVYQRLIRMVRLGFTGRSADERLRVLDVGAGCGVLSGVIVEMNTEARITAVDLSEKMLAVLCERYPQVNAVQSDILEFSSPSDFDSIWFNACFGNLWDPRAVLRHVAGQMSYGGQLHVTHPMGRSYQQSLHEKEPDLVPHGLPDSIEKAGELALGTGLVVDQLIDEDEFYMLSYRLE